jgi:hypothetical protein
MWAVRWLRETGDDAEVDWLLAWYDAVPGSPVLQAWHRAIGIVTLLDRAEIAEAQGHTDRAVEYYSNFLDSYDLPNPAVRPYAERGRAGLQRLVGESAARP